MEHTLFSEFIRSNSYLRTANMNSAHVSSSPCPRITNKQTSSSVEVALG